MASYLLYYCSYSRWNNNNACSFDNTNNACSFDNTDLWACCQITTLRSLLSVDSYTSLSKLLLTTLAESKSHVANNHIHNILLDVQHNLTLSAKRWKQRVRLNRVFEHEWTSSKKTFWSSCVLKWLYSHFVGCYPYRDFQYFCSRVGGSIHVHGFESLCFAPTFYSRPKSMHNHHCKWLTSLPFGNREHTFKPRFMSLALAESLTRFEVIENLPLPLITEHACEDGGWHLNSMWYQFKVRLISFWT